MGQKIPVDVDNFTKKVNEEAAAERKHILDGKCTSFEDYRGRTGRLKGMVRTLEIFRENMDKEEGDDE